MDYCLTTFGEHAGTLVALLQEKYVMWPPIIENNFGVKAVVRSKFFVAEQIDNLWNELFLPCTIKYDGNPEEANSNRDIEFKKEFEHLLVGKYCNSNFNSHQPTNEICETCSQLTKRPLHKNFTRYTSPENHVRMDFAICTGCCKLLPEFRTNHSWCRRCTACYCNECSTTKHATHERVWSELRFSEAMRDNDVDNLDILCLYAPSFTNFGSYAGVFKNQPTLYEGLVIQGGIRFGIKYTGTSGQVYQGEFSDDKEGFPCGYGKNSWRSGCYYKGGVDTTCPLGWGKIVFNNNGEFEGVFEKTGLLTSSARCGVLRMNGSIHSARLLPVYFTLYQVIRIEMLEPPFLKLEADFFGDGVLSPVDHFENDILESI